MLQILIALSALGLLSGEESNCESGSSPLLPHTCPLVEKSGEHQHLQLSDAPCKDEATLTSAFDGSKSQPELPTASVNMTRGSTSAVQMSGEFSYDLHMGLFQDGRLARAVTPDTELALGQRLWVKLEVRGVAADALGLTVHRCWATNEPTPASDIQHSLISDGCPDPGAATVAVISNGASLSSIFSFRVFRFVSKVSRDVFLHCQARLCVLAHGCVPVCSPRPE